MDGYQVSPNTATLCAHCGGPCEPQRITLTLQSAQYGLAVIRNVPADVCQHCGESQFSVLTTGRMMAALHTNRAPDEVAMIPIYDLAATRP